LFALLVCVSHIHFWLIRQGIDCIRDGDIIVVSSYSDGEEMKSQTDSSKKKKRKSLDDDDRLQAEEEKTHRTDMKKHKKGKHRDGLERNGSQQIQLVCESSGMEDKKNNKLKRKKERKSKMEVAPVKAVAATPHRQPVAAATTTTSPKPEALQQPIVPTKMTSTNRIITTEPMNHAHTIARTTTAQAPGKRAVNNLPAWMSTDSSITASLPATSQVIAKTVSLPLISIDFSPQTSKPPPPPNGRPPPTSQPTAPSSSSNGAIENGNMKIHAKPSPSPINSSSSHSQSSKSKPDLKISVEGTNNRNQGHPRKRRQYEVWAASSPSASAPSSSSSSPNTRSHSTVDKYIGMKLATSPDMIEVVIQLCYSGIFCTLHLSVFLVVR
jgi:hypothetical protein